MNGMGSIQLRAVLAQCLELSFEAAYLHKGLDSLGPDKATKLS